MTINKYELHGNPTIFTQVRTQTILGWKMLKICYKINFILENTFFFNRFFEYSNYEKNATIVWMSCKNCKQCIEHCKRMWKMKVKFKVVLKC